MGETLSMDWKDLNKQQRGGRALQVAVILPGPAPTALLSLPISGHSQCYRSRTYLEAVMLCWRGVLTASPHPRPDDGLVLQGQGGPVRWPPLTPAKAAAYPLKPSPELSVS